jgi:hypothetical protein
MEQSLGNLLLMLVFACAYCAIANHAFFLVWFRFPELQAKLIKRNEAHIRSRWSFASMANVWIRHWSYKWLARFNTLLLLLAGWGFVFVTLYGLLQVLRA